MTKHEQNEETSLRRRDSFITGQVALGTGFGELSQDLVKAATGKHDLAIVTKFTWCNKALQKISGLDQCVNLLELDLTGNNLTGMSGLSALVSLRKLTLTSNRITEVSSISQLASLEHLLLQANMLSTLESCNLDMLAQLPSLRTLYLRNIDRSQANAVCRHRDYKRLILAALPALGNLDGERNPHASMYSHQIEEAVLVVEAASKYKPNLEFTPPTPWFHPRDFDLPCSKAGKSENIKQTPELKRISTELVDAARMERCKVDLVDFNATECLLELCKEQQNEVMAELRDARAMLRQR